MKREIFPKNLYKYLHNERIDVLKNLQIRFTQPSSMNDPFELRPIFEVLFSREQLDEILTPSFHIFEESLRKEYAKLTDEQKSQITIENFLAVVRNNPIIIEEAMKRVRPQIDQAIPALSQTAKEKMYDVINNNIGILSLTESIDNELMWAHYANSHKGYVVEFDAKHNFFNRSRSKKDEFFHLRKVLYLDRNETGVTFGDLNGDSVFLTKSKSWEYEKEWRILIPLEHADKKFSTGDEDIHLFNYPLSSIRSIIVGAKANEKLVSEVIQISKESRIPIKKARLDPSNHKITIVDI